MNKKFIILAAMAAVFGMSFTACSNNDDIDGAANGPSVTPPTRVAFNAWLDGAAATRGYNASLADIWDGTNEWYKAASDYFWPEYNLNFVALTPQSGGGIGTIGISQAAAATPGTPEKPVMTVFVDVPLTTESAGTYGSDTQKDIMFASIEDQAPLTTGSASLSFKHGLSQLVFKGGTSLSKGWNLIERFSEDIDLAINPAYFGVTDLPTKKQIKSLRKRSSLFVAQELAGLLQQALDDAGLSGECRLEVQPDGEGDGTYPEPRVISLYYRSLYEESSISYVQPIVKLEVGARSLIEPTEEIICRSMVSEVLPVEDYKNIAISVAAPQKTFLEKVFLLHELFSIERESLSANRRSRHLYDIERMMDKPFAIAAVKDDALWEHIRQHRMAFTAMAGVDYNEHMRAELCLTPPERWMREWKEDYQRMSGTMIYGEKLPFEQLVARMKELEERFRE